MKQEKLTIVTQKELYARLGIEPTDMEAANKQNGEYIRAWAEEIKERRDDLQHLTIEQIEDQLNAGM
jgi:hypothetical protein